MSMRKFLNSRWWISAMVVLVITSNALMGASAWGGNRPALIALVMLGIFWALLAIAVQRSWGKTIQSWTNTIKGWEETNKLLLDYCSLFSESLEELSTYDRERVEDIQERAITIGRMRGNRLKELERERHR